MPTGPYNRVASNQLAQELLDWRPQVPFTSGLRKTIDWYVSTKDADEVREGLASMLIDRLVSAPDTTKTP